MSKTSHKIIALVLPAVIFLGGISPVFAAETRVPVSKKATVAKVAVKKENHSAAEIDKRIGDLTAVSDRIGAMRHLSSEKETELTAHIQDTITQLNTLKVKIANDKTVDEAKEDTKLITESYRVYALVLPQVRILAAADRANTIIDMLTAMNTKMTNRITAGQASGKDMTAILAAQADLVAKLADAKLQITTATTIVSALVSDKGDATVLATNNATLKRARADLAVAETDLKAAQKDLKTMISGFKALGVEASAASKTTNQ